MLDNCDLSAFLADRVMMREYNGMLSLLDKLLDDIVPPLDDNDL